MLPKAKATSHTFYAIRQEGVAYTFHFQVEIENDNISVMEAFDTFVNGKKYTSRFGDAIIYKPNRTHPHRGVTIVVDKSQRKVVTAWRGDEKRSWRRGWPHMQWYP